MYQTLWNSINKQVKNSHAYAAFLAVSLMGWTTIGLLAGFLICMIGGMSFVTKVTVVLCSGGYTGLISWFLWRYFISVQIRTPPFGCCHPFTGISTTVTKRW